jgi:hypothetical protein
MEVSEFLIWHSSNQDLYKVTLTPETGHEILIEYLPSVVYNRRFQQDIGKDSINYEKDVLYVQITLQDSEKLKDSKYCWETGFNELKYSPENLNQKFQIKINDHIVNANYVHIVSDYTMMRELTFLCAFPEEIDDSSAQLLLDLRKFCIPQQVSELPKILTTERIQILNSTL